MSVSSAHAPSYAPRPAPAVAPAPDPTPALAPVHTIPFTMYTQEPVRTPGGGLTMPPLPPEACTTEASLDRLNYVSARAELILVQWVDRLAVFGISAGHDLDNFACATKFLWRLTAIRKSINALADDTPAGPDDPAPFPPFPTDDRSAGILPASSPADDSSLGARTSTSATPPPSSIPDNDQTNPLGPRTASSADAPVSNTAIPSSPSLSVPAVPACPTLSAEGIATFLSRTEADLAEATRPTPPILPTTPDSPPSHSSIPHSENPSHSSLPSHSPHSALRAPP